MSDVKEVLNQRGSRYGTFEQNAKVTEGLIDVIAEAMGQDKFTALTPVQREGLHMVCHKLSRIACGDPDYDDSWVDIAGYAALVANNLRKLQAMSQARSS